MSLTKTELLAKWRMGLNHSGISKAFMSVHANITDPEENLKIIYQVTQKIKNEFPCDPAIPLEGI